jgi:hypothetical protein
MRKCSKTRFQPLQMLKNFFFKNLILLVWKYAQMQQNTYITTPYIKKYRFKELDSGGLEVCAIAAKHVFNHFRR